MTFSPRIKKTSRAILANSRSFMGEPILNYKVRGLKEPEKPESKRLRRGGQPPTLKLPASFRLRRDKLARQGRGKAGWSGERFGIARRGGQTPCELRLFERRGFW